MTLCPRSPDRPSRTATGASRPVDLPATDPGANPAGAPQSCPAADARSRPRQVPSGPGTRLRAIALSATSSRDSEHAHFRWPCRRLPADRRMGPDHRGAGLHGRCLCILLCPDSRPRTSPAVPDSEPDPHIAGVQEQDRCGAECERQETGLADRPDLSAAAARRGRRSGRPNPRPRARSHGARKASDKFLDSWWAH